MQYVMNHLPAGWRAEVRGLSIMMRAVRWFSCACLFLVVSLTASPQSNSQTPLNNPPPRPTGILLPAANRPPDANDQMEMREQQTKKQNFSAANAERKKQIADDTAKLLKLAADLKEEVDKTSKDTLSLNVIRRADEIERLAHSVKEKMKLSVGGS
jgi:hypothetical protein